MIWRAKGETGVRPAIRIRERCPQGKLSRTQLEEREDFCYFRIR